MVTLVVTHHRHHHHHCYGRKRGHGSPKFDSFGSSPAKNFWGNNCRAFQSGAGLLPTPLKSAVTPATKNGFSASHSCRASFTSVDRNKKYSERNMKSDSGPIPIKLNFETEERKFDLSESWAGTAYSNSPPPSSLPLPMFALRPKRSVSLDMPARASEIDLQPAVKSAPVSPTRVSSPPFSGDLFDSTEYATITLRRMLNLEITEG